MPEGDTIHRAAARLAPVMRDTQVERAWGNGRHIDPAPLVGDAVRDVSARGKHMMIFFESGLVMHSHMGMTGSWHLYKPKEQWQKPQHQASVVMDLRKIQSGKLYACVVCFSPKTLEILTPAQYRRHPFINRLGPDLMSDALDREVIVKRFRVHNDAPLGEAVLNQTLVCGIGNVYKSETLFLKRMDPFSPVSAFTDDELFSMIELAQHLMHKNRVGHPRQTRLSGDRAKVWVYNRKGEPCFECNTLVMMRRQGDLGRSTYYCPQCQPSLEVNR